MADNFSINDFVRTNVYVVSTVDYSRVQKSMTINIAKNIKWFGRDFKRAVKRQISKDTSRSSVVKVRPILRTPTGKIVKKTVSSFMHGKRSVAGGQGRGGRMRLEPKTELEYRWNRVSKSGGKPRSHPANRPGWQDNWLYNAVLDAIDGNIVTVFVNPAPPRTTVTKVIGSGGRLYPRTLELGGTYSWSRSVPRGYVVETVQYGVTTRRGNSRSLNKKDSFGGRVWRPELNGGKGKWVLRDDKKNKSRTTRRSHFRRFRQPHVVLSYDWRRIGKTQSMAPRPFLTPALEKFLGPYLKAIADRLV